MNFLASKWLGCTRCLQVFVIKWHARSSSKKKQNSHFFPSFFPSQILFFSPQAPPMSKHNKNLHAACRPEPLWCQKISYFFEFSCYFFEFTIHRLTYLLFFLWHELLECPNSTKICTHLANLSIFDPTNFQIF